MIRNSFRPVIRWPSRHFSSTSLRFNTIKDPFNGISSIEQLKLSVNEQILSLDAKVPDSLILQSLKACKEIKTSRNSATELEELSTLVNQIVNSPNSTISVSFLKSYFLTNPPSSDVFASIEAFYKRNPTSHIPQEVSMVPFRRLIYNGDVDEAFKLVDLTAAHPRYLAYRKGQLRRVVGLFGLSAAAMIASLEVTIRSGFFGVFNDSLSNLYLMLVAYIGNTSLLASLAFAGKVTRGGTSLNWDQGVMQNYWYHHADELKMCSRIVDVDAIVNGVEGFATAETIENVVNRKMVPLDNEKEIMFQQYWAGGGDGFEWVEPDQDPAEIMWKDHISGRKNKESLQNDLKWTERLIENEQAPTTA